MMGCSNSGKGFSPGSEVRISGASGGKGAIFQSKEALEYFSSVPDADSNDTLRDFLLTGKAAMVLNNPKVRIIENGVNNRHF